MTVVLGLVVALGLIYAFRATFDPDAPGSPYVERALATAAALAYVAALWLRA